MVWDAMKAVLRGKLISTSSYYLKQKREHKERLLQSIKKLETQHKATCNPTVYKRLLEERKKLNALELNQIQRKILYLNQKHWLKSPKSLKLLSWRVKTKRSLTQICTIRDAARNNLTSTPDILEAFRKYYSELYSSSGPEPTKIKESLDKYFPSTKLSEEHVAFLEEMATPEEVAGIITSLKTIRHLGRWIWCQILQSSL